MMDAEEEEVVVVVVVEEEEEEEEEEDRARFFLFFFCGLLLSLMSEADIVSDEVVDMVVNSAEFCQPPMNCRSKNEAASNTF